MLIGACWPYLDQRLAPTETWELAWQLDPACVRIASNAAPDDLQSLHHFWPHLRFVVRAKLPKVRPDGSLYRVGDARPDLLDYREWPSEPSLRDCLERLLGWGHSVDVEPLNEPDIEWDEAASWGPAERWLEAARDCAHWLMYQIDNLSAAFPGARVVGPALSQGWPERHAAWISSPFGAEIQRRGALAVHAYTDGRPFDDPDWGGRPLAYREYFPGKSLLLTETNDNRALFAADPHERAQHLAEYLRWLAGTGAVEMACLFALPGQPNTPAWWSITPEIIAAAREALSQTTVDTKPDNPPEEAPRVWARDELIALSNRLADEHGIPREVMLGCAIAESILDPAARRPKDPADDARNWPDVSSGLWQQTVRWSREYLDLGGDGSFPDPNVVFHILHLYADPEHAGAVAAPQLEHYWNQERDALNALCRYNKPRLDPAANPNRPNYARGLNEARTLLGTAAPPPAPVDGPVDLRGQLPTSPEASYGRRELTGIGGVTIHYTAGPVSQTTRAVAAYQTSEAARAQTGNGTPFPGLAYTLFIEADGAVYLAHDLGVRVWHSAAVVNGLGRNYTHVGVCYAGDREPNPAQKAGLRAAIRWLEAQLGRTLAVEGHRDVYPTSCPGPAWPGWKADIMSNEEDPAVIAELQAQLEAKEQEKQGLVVALADVCDRLGDGIAEQAGALKAPRVSKPARLASARAIDDIRGQMGQVRQNFIGLRPAA